MVSVGGMGIEVFVPVPALATMPSIGEKVKVYTYLHVREAILALYGFLTEEDRALFEDLLKVSGVGPKMALRVLGVPTDDIRRAILADDETLMPAVKGVGPKLRKAIILALRDRLTAGRMAAQLRARPENEAALAALGQLGYSRAEAREALVKVPASVISSSERVRAALKYL